MPNHFHLLLFQNKSSPTLTNLIRKVSVAYAMYFQYKYKHSGALFQGTYKCVKIFEDEQLLYLTKYIHLNPQKSEGSVPSKFPYSSLKDYLQLNNKPKDWLDPKTIMKKFFPKSLNCPKDYLAFIKDQNNSKLKQLLKQKTLD